MMIVFLRIKQRITFTTGNMLRWYTLFLQETFWVDTPYSYRKHVELIHPILTGNMLSWYTLFLQETCYVDTPYSYRKHVELIHPILHKINPLQILRINLKLRCCKLGNPVICFDLFEGLWKQNFNEILYAFFTFIRCSLKKQDTTFPKDYIHTSMGNPALPRLLIVTLVTPAVYPHLNDFTGN